MTIQCLDLEIKGEIVYINDSTLFIKYEVKKQINIYLL